MFGIFKNKSAPEEKQQANPAETAESHDATAPGTEIRYSPTLIDELKNDHQKLFPSYLSIKARFDQGDFEAVSTKLNDFRFELHNHLLTENVRLYIYLGRMINNDAIKYEMVRGPSAKKWRVSARQPCGF